jgi:hypothetical protein
VHCRQNYRVKHAGCLTQVVCNARGHVRKGEANGYDTLFTVEIG